MSFTEDLVGSFVEVLMAVFLMKLFSEDYFKNKIKLIAAVILISMTVSVLDLLDIWFTLLANFAVMVIFLRIVVKRYIFGILFEAFFSLTIVISIEYVLLILFYKFQGADSLNFQNRCMQLIICAMICLSLGLNHKLKQKVQLFYERYLEEIYFISATLFCFSAIELVLWKNNSDAVFHQSAIISIYTTLLFSLCLFLLKKLIENRKQRENIHLHEQYMETTENLLDSLYSEKHDFNKHLQAIQGLCQYGESQKAVDEIERYIGDLKSREQNKKKSTVSISTGNGVINALLYSKAKEAEKRSIQFYYVPGGSFPEFPCEVYEMVQILGNLLDNAFEYLEALEEDRVVTLIMDEWEGMKRIEIRNTCHLEKSFTAGISSKSSCSTKSGERRGYGLRNVKDITLKHHGKLRIFQEDNQFIIEILFQ